MSRMPSFMLISTKYYLTLPFLFILLLCEEFFNSNPYVRLSGNYSDIDCVTNSYVISALNKTIKIKVRGDSEGSTFYMAFYKAVDLFSRSNSTIFLDSNSSNTDC